MIWITFPVLFIFYSFNQLSGSAFKQQELFAKAQLYNSNYPLEKLYLHLDRPSYWAGEDVWFKSYLLNGVVPECNLYVELINSSGKIINKNLCWSQNGLAYGDFLLPDTLSSGVYQVRAYTDWMRNFGEEAFFRKNIVIWGFTRKEIKEESTQLKSRDADLQFLPEGGTFIANLKNRVAFKAVDKNGKGIDVEGKIIDSKGNEIIDFKSQHNGMGSFVFIPEENKKYEAEVIFAGRISFKYDLPAVRETGVRMMVERSASDAFTIEVAENSKSMNANKKYMLVGQTNGNICYNREIKLNNGTGIAKLNMDSLETGITKFTLFDESLFPLCERLVFINHNDFIHLEKNTNKIVFTTREKVKVNVVAKTEEDSACFSSLSLSVFQPENQLELEKYPENILSQFLLHSELKGTIEEPGWYFKDDSAGTQEALDNLMLTHGYRYFEWEEIINDKYPEIEYWPERSIQVKGQVTHLFTGKPVENCNVVLMSLKSLLAVEQDTTDSMGNFLFSNLFFDGTVYYAIQAGKAQKRSTNWIELDTRSSVSPVVSILPVNYRYDNEKQINTTYYLSELSSDLINRKWHLGDTIILGDINILAKEPVEATIHLRPYLEADYVFEVEKYDDVSADINEMMFTYSAFMRNFLGKGPQYFLDGVPVDPEFIAGLPGNWFEKVEAVRLAPTRNGFNPGLFYYTKRGESHKKVFDGMGMKSYKMTGYSLIRKFYSPDYDNKDNVSFQEDFRNTIYWNPLVRTDSTGTASVSFFNSDEPGTVQIVVEGITSEGKICRGIANYTVIESF